jgi:Tfp pilus assembly protein PilN
LLLKALGRGSGAVVQETTDGISIDLVVDGKLRYSRLAAVGGRLEAEVCRTYQVAGLPCGDIVSSGTLQSDDEDTHTSATTLESLVGGWDTIHLHLELPEVVAKRNLNRVRQKQRFAGVMAVAALALAGVVYSDRSAASAKVGALDARNKATLTGLKKQESAAEKELATQKALFDSLTIGLKPAQTYSDLITVASNRLPDGAWLGGVSVERGKIISLRGTAKTLEAVNQYLQNLGQDQRLRDVQLTATNNGQIDTTPVVQFSISAFPVGNLPLADGTSTTKKKS